MQNKSMDIQLFDALPRCQMYRKKALSVPPPIFHLFILVFILLRLPQATLVLPHVTKV